MEYSSAESTAQSGTGHMTRTNGTFQVPASIFAEPNMDTVKKGLFLNVAAQQQAAGVLNIGGAGNLSLQTPQLNLPSSMGMSPGPSNQLFRAHNLIPHVLESPDLKMLGLTSPELEGMLAILSPMHSPFAPTPRLAGGSVEEADVVSALNELYQRSRHTTPDKISPRSVQSAVNANSDANGVSSGSRNDDSPSVVRPIPFKLATGVSLAKDTNAGDYQRSESRLTSASGNAAAIDAAKQRLTAIVDATRRLAAAATSKTPVITPTDDISSTQTFMLLDPVQTNTSTQANLIVGQPTAVLNTSSVMPFANSAGTVLVPTAGHPGAVLLTALPSTIVQLSGIGVSNMLNASSAAYTAPSLATMHASAFSSPQQAATQQLAPTKVNDDEPNAAIRQQQSAISSSSSSNKRRSGVQVPGPRRRRPTDSDSSTNHVLASAASLSNVGSSNPSSPLPTNSKAKAKVKGGNRGSKKEEVSAGEMDVLNKSNGKKARGETNEQQNTNLYKAIGPVECDDDMDDSADDSDDAEDGQDDDGVDPPRRTRGRKLNPTEKLSRKRERNRLAAQRCRERKVKRISELQVDVAKLEADKVELLNRVAELTRAVSNLQRRIDAHEKTGCHVSSIPEIDNKKHVMEEESAVSAAIH